MHINLERCEFLKKIHKCDIHRSDKELIKLFRNGEEQKAIEVLVAKYIDTVVKSANYFSKKYPKVDFDDFLSTGYLELLKAIHKHNPSKGASLKKYIKIRAHFSMLGLVRNIMSKRLSRAKWMSSNNIIELLNQIFNEFCHKGPLTTQNAGSYANKLRKIKTEIPELDASVEEFVEILKSHPKDINKTLVHEFIVQLSDIIDRYRAEKEIIIEDVINNNLEQNNPISKMFIRKDLEIAISKLEENERFVIIHYDFAGLTLEEIGELLLLSEGRICQIRIKALIKLRRFLYDYNTST